MFKSSLKARVAETWIQCGLQTKSIWPHYFWVLFNGFCTILCSPELFLAQTQKSCLWFPLQRGQFYKLWSRRIPFKADSDRTSKKRNKQDHFPKCKLQMKASSKRTEYKGCIWSAASSKLIRSYLYWFYFAAGTDSVS